MFEANLTGILRTPAGWDIHGRAQLAPGISCPFGPVSLKSGVTKTNVRADSSASRGAAEEAILDGARVLIPAFVSVSNGCVLVFKGVSYEIHSLHPRYSVSGDLDHYDCELRPYLS